MCAGYLSWIKSQTVTPSYVQDNTVREITGECFRLSIGCAPFPAGPDMGGPGGMGYQDQMGGGDMSDGLDDEGFSDGAGGMPESEDSGF